MNRSTVVIKIKKRSLRLAGPEFSKPSGRSGLALEKECTTGACGGRRRIRIGWRRTSRCGLPQLPRGPVLGARGPRRRGRRGARRPLRPCRRPYRVRGSCPPSLPRSPPPRCPTPSPPLATHPLPRLPGPRRQLRPRFRPGSPPRTRRCEPGGGGGRHRHGPLPRPPTPDPPPVPTLLIVVRRLRVVRIHPATMPGDAPVPWPRARNHREVRLCSVLGHQEPDFQDECPLL
ncbi:unnamed protein product [Musa hybrid cultivar]